MKLINDNKIIVFYESNLLNVDQAIQHLNCNNSRKLFFEKKEIPLIIPFNFDSYQLLIQPLLDGLLQLEKSDQPKIILTDKYINPSFQIFSDRKASIVSLFSFVEEIKYIYLAVIILSAAIEITEPSLCKQTQDFILDLDKTYNSLNSTIKKIFFPIRSTELSPFHVIIIHGIRTHAFWMEPIQIELQNSFGITSSIMRYGVINLISFLLFKSVQAELSQEVLVRILNIKNQYPHIKISIIAHSYSSLIIGKALELADKLNLNIKLEAVVMNGSILPENFDWFYFINRNNETGICIKRVLNICGDRDAWPVFAKHFAPNAGASGAFFFSENSNQILNIRLKKCDHSGMLISEIARDYWAKFIVDENFNANSDVPCSGYITRLEYFLSNGCLLITFLISLIIIVSLLCKINFL